MAVQRTYTDDELRVAVAAQHSWRGVLRELDLLATSAGSMRSARRHADRLGISYAHFTGQRRWSDEELAAAVAKSRSWSAVARELGLVSGTGIAALKGNAVRLGLDCSHLSGVQTAPIRDNLAPDRRWLFRAGAMLAAAWFEASGASVAWPLEPARYDLLVHVSTDDAQRRIQVKTTTLKAGSTYAASLSTSSVSGPGRRVYDPDEIDEFFIIDGDLKFYRIPLDVVGGRKVVHLSAYEGYRVPTFFSRDRQGEGVASEA